MIFKNIFIYLQIKKILFHKLTSILQLIKISDKNEVLELIRKRYDAGILNYGIKLIV